jgi:hypothetical protein
MSMTFRWDKGQFQRGRANDGACVKIVTVFL